MTLKNRLQRRGSRNEEICTKNSGPIYFFEGDMTICNYDHLVFYKKGVGGRDSIRIPDVATAFPQPDHQKSKFGLR